MYKIHLQSRVVHYRKNYLIKIVASKESEYFSSFNDSKFGFTNPKLIHCSKSVWVLLFKFTPVI